MEKNGQGSPSENSTGNNPQNPSPPPRSPEETYYSPNNRLNNVINDAIRGQIAAINNGQGGVTVDSYISIVVRNPISPPLEGAPPPPSFSRITRARILHLLTAQRIEGDYEHVLLATARTIAEFHSYLIQDIDNASAEEDFDQVDSPFDSEDDNMSPEDGVVVFYGVSPQEGDMDDNTSDDLVGDDDMTLEELFEEGERTAKLVCGDMFHYDCISRWLTMKNLCPLSCNRNLPVEIHRSHLRTPPSYPRTSMAS